MKKLGIFGAGGFARETMILLDDLGIAGRVQAFYETDDIWCERSLLNIPVLPFSRFEPAESALILAVGNISVRKTTRQATPAGTEFPTLVHPSVRISPSVEIGEGSIICAGSILTCDIRLGRYVNIDRMGNIGHDCVMGDYATMAPGVTISGNCNIGAECYLGAHSCVREKISIAPGITIGMGAAVVSPLSRPGVYVGVPAKLLQRS